MFKDKLKIRINSGIPEVIPQNLRENTMSVRIIDVRRPEEFIGELGHIDGAELVTLGDDLINLLNNEDRDQEIVFVCRSGGRSGQAIQFSQGLGYKNTANMTGGMILWNELKYPTVKN